jgi:transposase-like protein
MMTKTPIKPLNPTLWRTCRVLSGRTRLVLLRQVLQQPGQNVSSLAEQAGIGVSDASQELRRLQSRGLLRRTCRQASVVYLPVPDPQVATAAPLLSALRKALVPPDADLEAIAQLARGLGSERRIGLVRALRSDPLTADQWIQRAGVSPATLKSGAAILKACGWIEKTGKTYALRPAAHPVAAALLDVM